MAGGRTRQYNLTLTLTLSRQNGIAEPVIISHKQFNTFLSKRQAISHGLILEDYVLIFFTCHRQEGYPKVIAGKTSGRN